MKRETSQKVATWIIFSFIGVAIMTKLVQNPIPTLVFLAFIGTIFYLYKFPPKWLTNLTNQKPKVATKGKKRKNYPFRVIDGKKKSS
jgi:hypothetical protein